MVLPLINNTEFGNILPRHNRNALTNVAENTKFTSGYKTDNFKTFSGTLTSYYTVDPIVFFVQAAYQHYLERKNGNESVDPGNLVTLSPQMFFVVNPHISLNWGVRWSLQGSDMVDREQVNSTHTNFSYLFGVLYEIRNRLIFSVDTEFKNDTDYDYTALALKLTYRF